MSLCYVSPNKIVSDYLALASPGNARVNYFQADTKQLGKDNPTMRTRTAPLFLLLLLSLTGCHSSTPPPTPLTFYTLSNTKREGGQFLDTVAYPKLGYIAATPELSLTHLESVTPQKTSPGGSKAPVIQVRLTPEDTKRLTAFTKEALHKTIVIRLGETILMAPKVNDAITNPNLGITLREGPNTQTIEAGLKKLAE